MSPNGVCVVSAGLAGDETQHCAAAAMCTNIQRM